MIAGLFSAFFSIKIVNIIAEVAGNHDVPSWVSLITGPVSALVIMAIAIKWLSSQLEESKKEQKDADAKREKDRESLILALERNSVALDNNAEVSSKCIQVMESTAKVVEVCKNNHQR